MKFFKDEVEAFLKELPSTVEKVSLELRQEKSSVNGYFLGLLPLHAGDSSQIPYVMNVLKASREEFDELSLQLSEALGLPNFGQIVMGSYTLVWDMRSVEKFKTIVS